MGRKLLHLLNGLITCAVVAALVLAGAYAGYALWDNQQVYDAAETSLSEMKEIRAALGMPSTVSALTELRIPVDHPGLWSAEKPKLYDLELEVLTAEGSVCEYFIFFSWFNLFFFLKKW